MSRKGVVLFAGMSLGVMFMSLDASADVQACIAASEKGQRARTAGKLREAREHFVVCGSESCPALVRHDCAQWNAELAQTLPSVVFGAKDRGGRDLFDVTVSMDGETLVKKLDGKSVNVDPGKHTFRFEAPGLPPVTQVVLVKEGERARVFNVTFEGGGPAPSTDGQGPVTPSEGKEREHTPYPWLVVGLGAVGVAVGAVILATAPDRPSNCDKTDRRCTRLPGQSQEDYDKDLEQAGVADTQPVVGWATIGIGAALLVGGLVWHFLEPTGPTSKATALRGMPWSTGRSAGFALTF